MLLRFFLLILLIKQSTSTTIDELKDELRLVRQDIGLLKAENKNQSDQITLLKDTVEAQSKIIDQKIVQELNKKLKDCAMTGDENSSQEKQTFRMIPLIFDKGASSAVPSKCRLLTTMVYDGVFKYKTLLENNAKSPGRFYGPPTGCSDLSLLGYTLNGFYQVKSNVSSNSIGINNDTKLDTVFCAFTQPEVNRNQSMVENRIISRRDTNKIVFHVERSTDFELDPINPYITFDIEHLNLENAFNATMGIFTIPKSGLYLLFFKGMAIFPSAQEKSSKTIHLVNISFMKKNLPLLTLGAESVNTKKESSYIEFGKLVRGNLRDMISIFVSGSPGIKISCTNMSFTGYFYGELI